MVSWLDTGMAFVGYGALRRWYRFEKRYSNDQTLGNEQQTTINEQLSTNN